MSRQIQIRRGTTAQHTEFTGAMGEVTMDTDKKTIFVHDGTTVGGIQMARKDEIPTQTTIPETYDFVIEKGGTSNSWYRKYKSGWIEQGGTSSSPLVTFPTAFTNTGFTVNATSFMFNAGIGNISICYGSRTTTGVNIQVRWNGAAQDSAEKSWMACGF